MVAVSNPEVERLAHARYLSVTTFRQDGTPVATPVWVTEEGGYLQVITQAGSGEVKRLRSNAEVLLAPCDARGQLQGDQVPGRATVIEDPELLERAGQLQRQRYGLLATLAQWWARLRQRESVVLAITVEAETPEQA